MSYHMYTTKGITLSERPRRESDRVYSILTRDLGLLRATATGVRKGESKLRGMLEPVTLSSVSLVRGKEFWRITSSEAIQRISISPFLARPLALIESLVQGEASNQELFDALEGILVSEDTIDESLEIKLVSQILYHLGYMKESDLNLEKESLLKAINESLHHTHLVIQ